MAGPFATNPRAPRARFGVRPGTPIWAPTPGVPTFARILAWAFGGAMLITTVLALSVWRPVSVPTSPKGWVAYRSDAGYSIHYPNGWRVITRGELTRSVRDDPAGFPPTDLDARIGDHFLPAGGGIVVEVRSVAMPDGVSSIGLSALESQVVEVLSADIRYAGYAEAVAPPTDIVGLHAFTFRDDDYHTELTFRSREVAMSGAWTVRGGADRAFILVMTCPARGSDLGRRILSRIIASLQFTA